MAVEPTRVLYGISQTDTLSKSAPIDSTLTEREVTYESKKAKKIRQKFNPIYSNEEESNEIISFVSSNLVVELEPQQLSTLDGYVVIRFVVDTLGNFDSFKVAKSYNNWVDYALLGAMKELPKYGKRYYNEDNIPIVKQHQVVFTFGSFVKGSFGFQDELVRNNTQSSINKQRDEHFAKVNSHWKQWGGYTDINSRLEYNIKDGLKQEAMQVDLNSLENGDDLPPTINPTITITGRD